MSRKKAVPRDTAKDIILGLAPSGAGPREPREGIAQPIDCSISKPAATPQSLLLSPQIDSSAIVNLQNLFSQFQRQYNQFVNANQQFHERLEGNQNALSKKVASLDNAAIPISALEDNIKDTDEYSFSSQHLEDLKVQVSDLTAKLLALTQQVTSINSAVRNHANQLSQIGDKALTTATQRTESNLNLVNEQVAQLKDALNAEVAQRVKDNEIQAEKIARLQDHVRKMDMQEAEALQNCSKNFDRGRETLSDEMKKLNEKTERTGVEVVNTINECEVRLKEVISYVILEHIILQEGSKGDALEDFQALMAETRARLEFEEEFKRKWSDNVNDYLKNVEEVKNTQLADQSKYKERFAKINEALAALETHLEAGNKKIDKIITADIQSRRAHERGLLARANDIDDRVTKYILTLKQTIDDLNAGKRNVKLPTFDIDTVRREMESIAADKNKISMEGLLKLEEKVSDIQAAFMRENRDILNKVQSANEVERLEKLKTQLDKLNEIKGSIQSANEQLRDKIERQIPKDLNELSAKTDNMKHHLETRIDSEREERLAAIGQLENKLGKSHQCGVETPPSVDINKNRVAIKKLAESVTTIKNVLDSKINDEIQQRERAIEDLSSAIRSHKK